MNGVVICVLWRYLCGCDDVHYLMNFSRIIVNLLFQFDIGVSIILKLYRSFNIKTPKLIR